MRDRLIELLDECIEAEFPWDHNGYIADHLLANGVTVQEWISVKDRLPEIGEIVLAFGKRHATSGKFRGAVTNPCCWLWRGNMYKDVTHWMPLPKPPKGE